MEPLRRSFKSMGTVVRLIAAPESDPGTVRRAEAVIKRVFTREDARFSRFRPDSELCRVNANAGRWVHVTKPFAELTEAALRAARQTDGLFDPTVLPALVAAGYDRDFKEVVARGDREDEALAALRRDFAALMLKQTTACGAWREVQIRGTQLRLPEGAALDFGGIAKGWTVDRVARWLTRLPWAIVDAGGDLRIVGNPPDGWVEIGVEDPQDRDAEALRLRLRSGALATTSVTIRAWGDGQHHIIDPRTSLPAMTSVVQATVWRRTCAEAEIWSKAALLRGPDILDEVAGCLVMASGEVVTNLTPAPGHEDLEQVPA